eukprot:Gb_26452 [translate_table: standard]
MFLNVVDCNGELKDATFIANILIDAIESFGPSNVVQVITDNARVCKADGLLVEARAQKVKRTMLDDIWWGRVRYLLYFCEPIVSMIRLTDTDTPCLGEVYEGMDSMLEKIKEVISLELLEVKSSLCNMVTSDVWDIWRLSNTDRAQEVKRTMLDDIWWGRVRYLLHFCKPIVSMIRLTDTNTPCLGEVYEGMDSMLEKIREVIRLEEKDESETFNNEIQDIIVKRWNKMTTPLHTLAYALNPKFYHEDILSILGRKAPNKDKEVSDGYKKAFRKLYPNAKMACDVRMEFS